MHTLLPLCTQFSARKSHWKEEVLVEHTFSGEDFDLVRYLKEGQFDFSSVNAFNFVAIRDVFISLGERWFKDLP